MNDPDRRQTSDGFDHDAMFAEIVAHWNDAATEPEPATAGSTEDAATDGEPEDKAGAAEDVGRLDLEAVDDRATDDRATDDRAADDRAGSHGADDDQPADRAPVPDAPVFDAPVFDVPAGPSNPSPPPAIPAPQAWRAHEVDDEYEEHFEPPPVAPLPVGDLQFWGILAGMGGGPLLLLYLVLFNREAGSYWMFTAIAMSVGGFALLVARLPRDHSDDGDDNGARL